MHKYKMEYSCLGNSIAEISLGSWSYATQNMQQRQIYIADVLTEG